MSGRRTIRAAVPLGGALLATLGATLALAPGALAAPPPEPVFRGAERLPEAVRTLDRPLARWLVLETARVAGTRVLRAAVARAGEASPEALRSALAAYEALAAQPAPGDPIDEAPSPALPRLRIALGGGDEVDVVDPAALAERRAAVAGLLRARVAATAEAGEDPALVAWRALAATVLGDGPPAAAREGFAALIDARRAAETELDAALLIERDRALLWPKPWLATRGGAARTRAAGTQVLAGAILFPPAERGSLTLRFPGSFIAALGLTWVEAERYGDALHYVYEPERLPVVMAEAKGLSRTLRALDLERTLSAAGARAPESLVDGTGTTASGPETVAFFLGAVAGEDAAAAAAATGSSGSHEPSAGDDDAATGSESDLLHVDGTGRSRRGRSRFGIVQGAILALVALGLAFLWRKLRGGTRRRAAAAARAAASAGPADDPGPLGAADRRPSVPPEYAGLLAALAGGGLLVAALAAPSPLAHAGAGAAGGSADGDEPVFFRVPRGAGEVRLDGSVVAVADLDAPPAPLGPARLLVPAGRHVLRAGAAAPVLVDGRPFGPVYAIAREAETDPDALARFIRERGELPDDPLPAHLLGNHLARNGHEADAVRCWRRALQVNSAFVPAVANLAVSWARGGQKPRAAVAGRLAIALDPSDAYGLARPMHDALIDAGVPSERLAGEGEEAASFEALAGEETAALDREARNVVRTYRTLQKYIAGAEGRAKAESNAGVYLQSRERHEAAAVHFRAAIGAIAAARRAKAIAETGFPDRVRPSNEVAAQIYRNLIRSLEKTSPAEAEIYRLVLALEEDR